MSRTADASPNGALGLIARAAGLVAAGAALGLVANAVHPHGVHLGGFAAPVACTGPAAAAQAEGTAAAPVEVLPVADVARLCADPGARLADARPAERFAEGHVTGAIHLPCTSSTGAASAALAGLAGKRTLVVYGDGTDDALPVAEEMRRRLGATPDVRVVVMAGGFPAWSRAGLACTSGPCAECAVPEPK